VSSIFNKLKDFVGLNEIEDEYDYIEEDEVAEETPKKVQKETLPEPEEETFPSRRRYQEPLTTGVNTVIGSSTRSNVIGMPGIAQGASEVVVIEPHAFEEMPKVIEILKERRSVVLNLNVMDPEEAQRAVDFVAGGTYAIDGHQERIGESIFLFTPNCVKVSTITGIVSEVSEMTESTTPKVSRLNTNQNWSTDSDMMAQ
jgi:cell division inhibitor SepF